MAKKKTEIRIVEVKYLGKMDLNKYFRELLVENLNRSADSNQKWYIDENEDENEEHEKS